MAKGNNQKTANGSALEFEAQLWAAADKMRGHMDASEFNGARPEGLCLGLIFLKYISDAFEEKREQLLFGFSNPKSEWFIKDEPQRAEAAENRDFFSLSASNGERAGVRCRSLRVPPEARWHTIKAKAKSPEIGKIIDNAMTAIGRENPSLKPVLSSDYARPSRLEMERKNDEGRKRPKGTHQTVCATNHPFVWQPAEINGSAGSRQTAFAVGNIRRRKLSGSASRAKQSRVHRQMRRLSAGVGGISLLAGTAGRWQNHRDDKVATASCRVRRAYRHLRHDHQTSERIRLIGILPLSFCLQTSHGLRNADSFRQDLHPDLKADFILANPPFNMSDWGGENLRQDVRWKFGMPPVNNANYAWIQHFIHHLSPAGMAGFVLANGSMSTQTSNEGEIRKTLIEADLVDCMVALPGQLFFTTPIPVCLWFLARDKKNHKRRDRRGETLFIDTRKMGVLVDRIHRELTAEEIAKISDCYHAWKSKAAKPAYADEAGFCKSVKLEEICSHGYVLTPGRYVGAAEVEDDGEMFEDKMKRLTATLEEQFTESAKLEKAIEKNLKGLGYGG